MSDILTRREARQQAQQNKGYNRSQFQTAMINAKKALRDNSNLRGRELRQTARRMVAGTGEYAPSSLPPTFEEGINSPVLAGRPSAGGGEAARAAVQRGISKANKIDAITPIVNPDTNFSGLAGRPQQEPPTADLTGAGNFNNAFALARKNGMKVFTWNGKKYGTKTDPNWRQRWGLDERSSDSSKGDSNSSGSSASDLGLTGKVDNWNISDILPEDIYNDLESSFQTSIDEYLAQEDAAIQDEIKSLNYDLGPTMKTPGYMVYMPAPDSGRKPGWYSSRNLNPDQYNWYRKWRNNKYGDYFVSKDGSKTYFNPHPEDYQKKYRRAAWLDDFTHQRPQYDK